MKAPRLHSRSSLLILGIFTLFILSIAEGKERSLTEYNDDVKNLHNQPRSTFKGEEVPASVFLAESASYFQSLAVIAIGPFVVGVVSIISGFVYCVLRLGCKKCKADSNSPDASDSKKSTRVMAILVIVFSVVFLAVIAVGIYGNSLFEPVMTDFFDHTAAEAQAQKSEIDKIEPALVEIDANRTALKGFVDALTRDGDITVEQVNQGKSYISDNNTWRMLVLCFSYAILGVIVVLSILGIIIRNDKVLLSSTMLCFFALFLFWFNFGLHYPFSVVTSDICYDIAEAPLSARIQARIDTAGVEYRAMNEMCHCPSWSNSNRTYFFTFELRARLEEERNTTTNTTEIDEKLAQLDLIQPVTKYVRDCLWLEKVFNAEYEDKFCGDYTLGLILVWATSLVAAFFLIPYTVFVAILSNRFDISKDGFF